MIPRSASPCQKPEWQIALSEAITCPETLFARLELPSSLLPGARKAAGQFDLRVPPGFVERMEKGDPADPLLRQVLPLEAELEPAPGFGPDPVGDLEARVQPKMLQKYRGRALLLASGACPLHCRYCFRRHFPYREQAGEGPLWQEAVAHLRAHPELEEVILSGGDPLMLTDSGLTTLIRTLETLPQLKRLRIHSRLPVVLPERVTDGLLELLACSRFQPVLVIHCNHPNELDAKVRRALLALRKSGTTLLNQSVLLHGVNDTSSALKALSEALFAAGTLPYYLHMLDRVQGAAHFEVPEQRAVDLLGSLRRELPGYLVPRLVREEAGTRYKQPVCEPLSHS